MIMTHAVQHTVAGEGIELTAPDAVVSVKVDADHTDGLYELLEIHAPRGPATPLHRTGWAKTTTPCTAGSSCRSRMKPSI